MFKQIPTAMGSKFTHKICLNASNKYAHGFGNPRLAKIKVSFIFACLSKLNCVKDLLNPQNKYLVDNVLELLVDVTIAENETEQIIKS